MRENDVTPSNVMEMKIDVTKKSKWRPNDAKSFGTPRPIPWIRPRMYHAGFHDEVMGNHANTITSLNGSETNGHNTPR